MSLMFILSNICVVPINLVLLKSILKFVFLAWLALVLVLFSMALVLIFNPYPTAANPDQNQMRYEVLQKIPYADGFDFPVGPKGSAVGYFDVQPFGKHNHRWSKRIC